MEEEIDYMDRSNAMLIQYQAAGNLIAMQNAQYIQDTQKLIENLRQRFNSIVAVSESRRELSNFFNDKDINATLS